jgi:hypothetical protein
LTTADAVFLGARGHAPGIKGESIFLKTDQIDTSLLDSSLVVLAIKLNALGAQAIIYHYDDLAQAIKNSLPNDPNIGPYLENLRNPHSPRELEDVKEFLKPFSMNNDLVLRNGLVYVPQNDDITNPQVVPRFRYRRSSRSS